MIELSEGHLHRHPYFHLSRVTIGHFELRPPATLEVDHSHSCWRVGVGGQVILGEGEDLSLFISEAIKLKLVLGLAYNAHPRRTVPEASWIIVLRRSTAGAPGSAERQDFPAMALQPRDGGRCLLRSPSRLQGQQPSPTKVGLVVLDHPFRLQVFPDGPPLSQLPYGLGYL